MKRIDAIDLKTCQIQGKLFQESANLCNSGSAIFVRRFMNSDLARRIDGSDLSGDVVSLSQMLDEIERQYGVSNYGSQKYASEVLYWMGYTYRYWCIAAGKSSCEVYRICPAREMASLYPPYHTLDPEQAILRIYEAKGLQIEQKKHSEGYVEEGIEILRRIRALGGYNYYVTKI